MTPRHSPLATALGIVAMLLWACTVAVARSVMEYWGTLTGAMAVYLLAGVLGVLSLLWRKTERRNLRHASRLYLFGCGALFVLYMVCIYLALGYAATRLQVIGVGVINYFWPTLMLLFAIPILGVRPRWTLWPGMALAIAGVVLAVLASSGDANAAGGVGGWTPYLLAMVAAVSWGLYSNLSRKWGGSGGGNAVPLFLLATGLVLVGLWAFSGESLPPIRLCPVLEVVFMATCATLLAYSFWDAGMRRGNILLIGALSYSIPILSTLIAALYLRTAIGPGLWGACGFVFAGAVLCKRAMHEGGSEIKHGDTEVTDTDKEG